MDKENILYYQTNIKTSRNEDSVYAIKYASQQMLIDKLEQQVKKQKEVIDKAIKYIEKFIPIDEDTILMRERQRDYLLDILEEGKNE